MHHRHLLPQELDLLVDGDVGFGVAPLRAHAESCDDCRAQLDELRAIAAQLDTLPHFVPRHGFADRVMTQVQVIEPWHVALTEQARALVPQSTGLRVLAAVGAGLVATTISGSALWFAFRADLLAWSYSTMVDQGSKGLWAGLASAAGDVVSSRGDLSVLALGAAALTLTSLGAVMAFRRLAATARANRS
jgi:hypothetical protein